MRQVLLVTCILLHYTKINRNFCLPAEGHTAEKYSLWDTFRAKNILPTYKSLGTRLSICQKYLVIHIASENKLFISYMSLWARVTMQILASNYTARKVELLGTVVPWVDKTLSKKYLCYKKDKVSYFAAVQQVSIKVWPRGGRTWSHVAATLSAPWWHSKSKNGCKLQGSLYGLSHDGRIVFSTKLKPFG